MLLSIIAAVYPCWEVTDISNGYTTYTVQSGDTVTAIATAFYGEYTYYQLILAANGLDDVGNLNVGQVLIIPWAWAFTDLL